MSEQEQFLKQMLLEIQEIKATMATKKEIEEINHKLDKLSESIDKMNLVSLRSDEMLLSEIRSIREGVIFVNRKIADTELEVNMMKQNNKQ